ncbi:MAG: glycosyltransferase [Coriobacteriia bacterium]|nr:glycosyltransferase [Coriobacteriia bacterium]
MNVLHVNNIDLIGRRFNGYDLIEDLEELGHKAHQCVLTKQSKNPKVIELLSCENDQLYHKDLQSFEKCKSWQNLIYPWARLLVNLPEFKQADIVHYHLIHNNVLSLLDLPWLFSLKPSVWTLHDPWFFTGHCVHPMQCTKWLSGCTACPDLHRSFPVKEDSSSLLWEVKRKTIQDCPLFFPLIASEWMKELYEKSPIFQHAPDPSIIPFGVRDSEFHSDKKAAREALGIPRNNFTIFFRSNPDRYKGLDTIITALRGLDLPNVTIITSDKRGLLGSLPHLTVKEFGWIDDSAKLANLYAACDVFVMPSEAEAFGLMAIEAMMSARLVICCEDTALPKVIGAPDKGIAIPSSDSTSLRSVLKHLSNSPDEIKIRAKESRELALARYSHSQYLNQLISHYSQAVAKFSRINNIR